MSLFKKNSYKFHDYNINKYSSLVAAKNDTLSIDERRYSNYVTLTAKGILLMGLWSFIKGFVIFMSDLREGIVNEFGGGAAAIIASAILGIIFFIIFLVADISFRYIIWKNAAAEVKKGVKKKSVVVFTVILMIYGAYIIMYFFYRVFKGEKITGDDVIALVFDVTSFVLLWNMLASLFKLRKVRDEIAVRDSENNDMQEE